jgi:alkylresorcinol/alkylpyrone synthase
MALPARATVLHRATMRGCEAPRLRSVGTALPPHTVSAEDTKALLSVVGDGRKGWHQMIDASRIRRRHVVVPVGELLHHRTLGERAKEYVHQAVALGERAARDALSRAAIHPGSVRTIVSVSCTGYMLPSLDAYLVSRLGLDATARRIPLTELGCSGGVAALGLCSALCHGGNGPALIVSVEPCSLCLQVAEPTASDIMGSILFGDAAAAAIVTDTDGGSGPTIVSAASNLWPASLDQLGMQLTSTGFSFILSPGLPRLVRARLRDTVVAFLSRSDLTLADIGFWIVHPGGPKILEAAAESLGLTDEAIRPAWDVWEACGNLSSATVFFILHQLQRSAPPAPDTFGVMMAFGPGVTCEMVLVRSAGWLANGHHS